MWLVLLLLFKVLPLALAQNDLSSTLDSYPSCAQLCIIDAFTAELCSPLDTLCICQDPDFRSNVTGCLKSGCTVIEALSVQNTSFTSCGAPVRDRSHELIIHSFTMLAFAVLLAVIRVTYKLTMRLEFGLDDYILVATAITLIPQTTLFMTGTLPNGLGKDIWTLTPDQITNFLKYWYIVAVIYFLQTALIKLAFVAFYMRIFTTLTTKRILWATFVVVAFWGVSFVLVGIFVCTPISYLWTQWDGLHDGKCLSDAAYVWANAGSNILLDIWVLAIPLWELRKLQLNWKKKIGVALMFGLGALVTVMSILRLKSLVLYQQRDNVTREFAEVYLWSSIEIGVGIICACLPTLRLLLVKIWPALSGTTVRDSNNWYRQSRKNSQTSRSTAHSLSVKSTAYSLSGKPLPPTPTRPACTLDRNKSISRSVTINGRDVPVRVGRPAGIAVEEEFVMEHHKRSDEHSDISLILMRPEYEDRHSHV